MGHLGTTGVTIGTLKGSVEGGGDQDPGEASVKWGGMDVFWHDEAASGGRAITSAGDLSVSGPRRDVGLMWFSTDGERCVVVCVLRMTS